MDRVGGRALRGGQVGGVQYDGCMKRFEHPPAEDTPTELVKHDVDEQKACQRGDVRDVRTSMLIRRRREEGPFR